VVPLAEEQARRGHCVQVFHVRKGDRLLVEPDRDLVESTCFRESVRSEHIGFSVDFARAIDTQIREFDVVHIHAVWNFPTWYTMRAARREAVPYMVAPQGSLDPWAFGHGRWVRRVHARLLEKPLLNQATCLQALTVTEQEQFRAFGLHAPSVVVPNGVSVDWLRPRPGTLRGLLGLADDRPIALYLSRIHPKKGLDLLLRGFAMFKDSLRDVVFVIAGDDGGSGYRGIIEALARDLSLVDRCVFLGEVSGERKQEILAGADLFVLGSRSEGLPVAVLEAMATGVPVLITPGCHLDEVSRFNAGVIVDTTTEAIGHGLADSFLDRSRLRERGANARELVRSRFTWPRIAEALVAEYERMKSPEGVRLARAR